MLALAVLLLVGVIPTAAAHDYLVSSNPAANSTQRSQPGTITLTFDDIVLNSPVIHNRVRITGPGGHFYETGCPTVFGRIVKVPTQLGPGGRYTVDWRIVSADGHPVTNHISFTYQPLAGTPAAPGTTGSTCATATTQTTATTPRPAAPTSSHLPVIVAAGIALLTVVALAVLVARRRPSPEQVP